MTFPACGYHRAWLLPRTFLPQRLGEFDVTGSSEIHGSMFYTPEIPSFRNLFAFPLRVLCCPLGLLHSPQLRGPRQQGGAGSPPVRTRCSEMSWPAGGQPPEGRTQSCVFISFLAQCSSGRWCRSLARSSQPGATYASCELC